MLDLPSVDKKILPFAIEIEVMKRGGPQSDQKPHKLIMLLAVLDLFDQELITENRIFLNANLIKNFEKFFRLYSSENDLCQPGPPFFHLRNSSFWKHKVKEGREAVYANIKSSGGGIKRIEENIEYSYFDDHIYSLISQKRYRKEIESFILSLLPKPEMKNKERIPTLFHETISLSNSSITQILKAISSTPIGFDFKSKQKREEFLNKNTTIGPNYVKSMVNFSKGSGFLDIDYQLLPFGEKVLSSDLLLAQNSTQWLMHYHLSAPLGPGPLFWHELVKTRFRSGDEFTTQEIAEQIGEIFEREEGKPLAERSARSTATIFLGTYSRSDALGNLGLIKEVEPGRFRVMDPDSPSTWVVGFALLHWWERLYSKQVTINLNDLYGDQGLTHILMIGKGRLNTALEELQDEGFVELYRIAPPYQVVLLRRDEEALLRKIYGQ